MQFAEPNIFKSLPFIAAGAGWKVSIDQTNIAKICLYDTAFKIAGGQAVAKRNIVWLYFRKDSHTAIAFFLSAKPMMVVAQFIELLEVYIVFSGLGFLQANNICRV